MFWVAFFIVIVGLFMVNQDKIRQTLENTQILTRLPISFPGLEEKTTPAEDVSDLPPVTVAIPETPKSASPSEKPVPPPAASSPDAEPTVKSAAAPVNIPAANSRERALYFTQVDAAGMVVRTKVTRKIPASDSPMVDSLKTLLDGPNAEEQRRGMVSLIPRGVKILSAVVRGSTAYISFSEEFQYNTYGVEGYAAQLNQIVWTATEFPTVKDVQILVEGRRIDYLGEGIWIGSPLSRDTLR
ncbi:hypothetical protein AGMMS49579_26220 [Spirochaetia bacterium]|nr:hypothetical protein AGMMS49579_26220 [Spirochaetia bacterium]